MSSKKLPDKLYFKIGEVAQLVGVKPHVLRYWEQETGLMRPMKTRGSHRMYRRQDVEAAVILRSLVDEQGYSIEGAKKRIRQTMEPKANEPSIPTRSLGLRAELLAVRADLAAAVECLDTLTSPLTRTSHITPHVETSPVLPAAFIPVAMSSAMHTALHSDMD